MPSFVKKNYNVIDQKGPTNFCNSDFFTVNKNFPKAFLPKGVVDCQDETGGARGASTPIEIGS